MGVWSGTGVYGAGKSSYKSTSGSTGGAGRICVPGSKPTCTQIEMSKNKNVGRSVMWWIGL